MTTTFDPAAWLAKMEAGGFDIHIFNDGINFMEPVGTRNMSGDDELEMWREYRGGDEVRRKLNSEALWAHLFRAGRVAGSCVSQGGAS